MSECRNAKCTETAVRAGTQIPKYMCCLGKNKDRQKRVSDDIIDCEMGYTG